MGEKRPSNTNMLEPWYEGLAAKNIVPKKYCHNKEDGTLENFDEFVERVSGIFSTPDLREAMRNSIRDADFFPAGRALYGAGSKGKFHATMSNCYVADFIPDSIEGIFDGCGKAGRTFSYGGGIGINLSKLRPCGSPVNNSAKTSTGACSYAHMFDAVAVHVGSNGRRSAMLIALDCHHPDIEEFLKLKQNNTAIQTANLSILFTDDFLRCVLAETEEEQQFTLFFESDKVPRVEKTINAREFFKEFCQSQYDFAEPGALFIDTLRRYNLLAGYPPDEYTVISTNPCGEFAGNAWNSCNLGSINLYNMVEAPFTEDAFFNFDKFARTVKLGVTALDEILDYGYDMQPLQENKDCLLDWRAIGLGIMGLADMAIALNIVYGSEQFNNLLDKIGREMLYKALKTSCELAKKFGAFGKFNADKVLASPMFDHFRQSKDKRFDTLLQDIRLYGLRNGSLLSVAPTGSVATMANLSGGFEPHFARIYERTTHANVGDAKKRFKVLPLAIAHYLHHNGIRYNVDNVTDAELAELVPASINAHEVKAADKVQTQATLQKWIDNAISCTVNLPEEATVEDIFNAYITAWNSGCKGLTVFRNGCKRTAIMSTLDNKKGAAEEETVKKPQDVTYDSIRPRKREHFCDNIYTTRLPSGSYVRRTACIDKMYIHIARDNEGRLLDIFTNAGAGCASNRDTITRLTSLCIRSGQAIDEVARELEAAPCAACQSRIKEKDMKRSCGAALASALREEYTLSNVTEEPIHVEEDSPHVNTTPASPQENNNHSPFLKCPECGETAALPEAKCVTCQNCGWSKC